MSKRVLAFAELIFVIAPQFQLATNDPHIAWGFNSKSYCVTANSDQCHFDVVTDQDLFVKLSS